ncbi:MAG: hypothetical protein QF486_00345 [Candidatus Woesearchaeota archaeon]|nr:hypothetical protein [Candidatus Woesearchaeota archaeon]MDP7198054.1 hypothetical protein [Candidatus Woesearchaeota archaeon]MDP7466888.1 hypothetical protein [Candidatus Woesearchaeota archaeon]
MPKCMKCNKNIRSYSVMRKWCVECRKSVAVEQARERRAKKR